MKAASVAVRLLVQTAIATSLLPLAIPAGAAGPVLPAPAAPFAGVVGDTPEQSRPAFPPLPRAPANAPNVLLVMTDDVGFGASSTFGGLIPTPALDRLASNGLRYNNFHTTAMCSPSRAALLTGRNSHNAGMGALSEFAQGYPGYYGEVGRSTATIAEILRQNGYNTAFIGKHHGTPVSEKATSGPFDSWPTGLGFEHFYGFVASGTDQWYPSLYQGTARIGYREGEHLDKMMADETLQWIRDQKAAQPEQPFFVYLAPGTAHAPLQAPKDWIAKFRGKFDAGWDVLRERIYAEQKAKRIIPAGTKLTPRPAFVPSWKSLTSDQQRVAARLMEVYAAQLAHQDYQFGRIIDELARMGQLENTLVIFVEGDNGASPEGGPLGTTDDTGFSANLQPENDAWRLSQLDNLGGPRSRAHYPSGWAWAMNTPFPYFKRIASHLGGIRNGMVTSWPKRIRQGGSLRPQFSHLIDVVPTILDAAGIEAPSKVNGVDQKPMDGQSLINTFDSPATPARRTVQYFELLGNRSLYNDGWLASTIPSEAGLETKAGLAASPIAPLDYKWALFNLNKDFSQSTDIAAQHPAKLKELQDLWWSEARRNNVLPINATVDIARINSEPLMRRPKQARYVYWGRTAPLERGVAPTILSDSFSLAADFSTAKQDSSGVIAAVGDEYGGWSFFLDKGRPTVVQAFSQQPEHIYRLRAPVAVGMGDGRVVFKVDYSKSSRAADVSILMDGKVVSSTSFPNRINIAAQGEGLSIGYDYGLAVTDAYRDTGAFDGEIRKVEISLTDLDGASNANLPAATTHQASGH